MGGACRRQLGRKSEAIPSQRFGISDVWQGYNIAKR